MVTKVDSRIETLPGIGLQNYPEVGGAYSQSYYPLVQVTQKPSEAGESAGEAFPRSRSHTHPIFQVKRANGRIARAEVPGVPTISVELCALFKSTTPVGRVNNAIMVKFDNFPPESSTFTNFLHRQDAQKSGEEPQSGLRKDFE